jgi:inorganic phosphate transporter, PiT family
VATVIYTHSLEPHIAVVWSGLWNFLGVLTSSGLVAFAVACGTHPPGGKQSGIRNGLRAPGGRYYLEPQHLVFRIARLQFSHSDRLDHRGRHREPAYVGKNGHQRRGLGASDEHREVIAAFTLVGFAGAFLLLSLMKAVVKNKKLYEAPEGTQPPPFWIRALLLLTCTGVSCAHGSNDGQRVWA